MKLLAKRSLQLSIVLLCLAGVYLFAVKPLNSALNNMALAVDSEACQKLGLYIESLTEVVSNPATNIDGRWFYLMPRRNAARITVHGVTNAEAQERMLSAIKGWQTTNDHLANLNVLFYAHQRRGDAPVEEGLLRQAALSVQTTK